MSADNPDQPDNNADTSTQQDDPSRQVAKEAQALADAHKHEEVPFPTSIGSGAQASELAEALADQQVSADTSPAGGPVGLPSDQPPNTPLAHPSADTPGPIIDPRTGVEVQRFIVDPKGNVIIEPAGGKTVGSGNGVFSESRYSNESPYQQQHGPQAFPEPHGHGFLEGPGRNERGPSLDIKGNVVPADSPEAHWSIRR